MGKTANQQKHMTLLDACKAAHRSLALARTSGRQDKAAEAIRNAEELLWDAIQAAGEAGVECVEYVHCAAQVRAAMRWCDDED